MDNAKTLVEKMWFKIACVSVFILCAIASIVISLIDTTQFDESIASTFCAILFIPTWFFAWKLFRTNLVNYPNADIAFAQMKKFERLKTKVSAKASFIKQNSSQPLLVVGFFIFLNLFTNNFLFNEDKVFPQYETYSLSWDEEVCTLTHGQGELIVPMERCRLFNHNFFKNFYKGTAVFAALNLMLVFLFVPMQKRYSQFMNERFKGFSSENSKVC